jgi:hypothetical protein
MSEQILIQNPDQLEVINQPSLLIEAAPNRITLDPSSIVVVEDKRPTLEIYLHGPRGLKGDQGDPGTGGNGNGINEFRELQDVLLVNLADGQLIKYNQTFDSFVNSDYLDGGNF